MTDTNTSPPTFPTPGTGEGATTATNTANASSPHSGSNSAAPLATMPEPSTAEVSTNPFSDLVAASHANDNNMAASSGGGATTYAPPTGPPPPPMTSSGSPLPPQQPPRPQEAQQNEQPSDPRVAGLKAMFPDYDDLVLLSVLDSVNGNQERAIDLLLGMSDPNYVGESQPAQQQTQQQQQPPSGAAHVPQANQVGMTQEELDEQFARQLMLEEQQQQQQEWESQYRVRQNRPRFQQPARPDQHGWQSQGAQGGQNQGGDTVTDLQQSFNRIAESGKKTFGSIFSKVKAKIQEMDQPRPGQSSGGAPPNTNPSTYPSAYQYGAGGGAGSDPWESINYESRVSANPPQIPATTRPQGFENPSPPPITLNAAPIAAPTAVPATQGYDVAPEPARETTPTPSMPVATSNATAAGSGPASPPRTGSGFGGTTPKPIDAGKLGLLPRKPVSLVRPENKAPPQPVARQDSEDSDGLEYAESPFDEHRK